MNLAFIFFPFAAIFLAFCSLYCLSKIVPHQETPKRYSSIDGLRGFLAFFVFLHHSLIWYFYIQNNEWTSPPWNTYSFFGAGSVMMFFMVTAFLFFNILIDNKDKEIDWTKFYIARILRLGPIYYVLVLVMFALVFIQTGLHAIQPLPDLIEDMIHWLFMGLLSLQDLNGIPSTLIFAGVLWSIIYEWQFYFTLPLVNLALYKKRIPRHIYFIVLLGIVLTIKNFNVNILLPFFSGAIVAFLSRKPLIQKYAKTSVASFLMLGLLILLINSNSNAYSPQSQVILFICFLFIASGNRLWGALDHPLSKILGHISYGIYLTHGIVLYTFFTFLISFDSAKNLSPFYYCLLVLLLVPILISICYINYIIIEYPATQKSTQLTKYLRNQYIQFKLNLRNKIS